MSKIYLLTLFLVFSTNAYSSVPVCYKLLAKEAQLLVDLEDKLELEKTYLAEGFVLLFQETAISFEGKKKALEKSFKDNHCRNDERLQSKREFFEAKLNEIADVHKGLKIKGDETTEKTICDIGLERLRMLYSEVVDQYEDKSLSHFDLFQGFSTISF